MKKQFLILVAAFLLLIGCSAVAAAEATTVATIGTAAYTSLQAAVDAYDGSTIRLEHTTDEAVSISKDVRLDLNGFDLTGAVTVTGGTLYALDSQTDDFTVNDEAGYGSVTNVTGSIAAASDYLMIQESGSYSFHRVDLQIHTMTLRPEEAGVYYKSNFAGDEIVAANVDRYGIALSIKAVPSAENIKTACATSYFTGFSAGSNGEGTSTLLKNVMKTANTDAVNTAQAKMPVYGRAYILTNDGSFCTRVIEPEHHVPKTYYIEVGRPFVPDTEARFAEGIVFPNGTACRPGEIEISDDRMSALVTVTEGKTHQVRRMAAACGSKVRYLKRVSIGKLMMEDSLLAGQCRELTKDELKLIFEK